MKLNKIYSNRMLYNIFSDVITKRAECTSKDTAEALRIRRKGIDIDVIETLLCYTDKELKEVHETVRIAEEISKTTDEVPKLCDL